MDKFKYIFIAIIFNIMGQLALKWSMLHFKDYQPSPFSIPILLKMLFAPFSIVGIVFYTISAIFWMSALTKVELSVAYPMLSLGYIFIFFISILLFNEPLKTIRLIGVILIVSGIYFISR